MEKDQKLRLYKKYLKERKLTRSFNTWYSLRKRKKKIVEVVTSNYDGTQSRKRLYAFSSKYGTIFRDFNTLQVLGKSRSKLKIAIDKARKSETLEVNKFFNGKRIEWKAKKNQIKIKNINSTYSYNNTEQRLREMRKTNTIIKQRVGSIGCDIEISKGMSRFRMRIRSRFMIINKDNINKAVDENIRVVSSKAGYTPDEVIIHEIWYEYWYDKREKLVRIR